MNIEMVPFEEGHVIPGNGKYLVRTVSTGPMKSVNIFTAFCQLVFNGKKMKEETRVGVSNQIVTHISCKKIE